MKDPFRKTRGFTLIELLIVIGVIAVLAVVIVLVLNPAQQFMQSRDARRVSDLKTIDSAVALYYGDNAGSLGNSSTTYISIPDPAATSTAGDQCQGLGLPSLPSGLVYHCAASSTYRKSDGTGWIPLNFATTSFGSSLNILPIDPTNQTSTGLYYTYTTDGSSYELTAIAESSRERTALNVNAPQPFYPGVDALGTNLALSALYNPSSMVGYWKFDEGTATSTIDSSGNGNTGTLIGGTWTSGKVGGALSFNGTMGQYVDAGDPAPLQLAGSFTISAWINPSAFPGTDDNPILDKRDNGPACSFALNVTRDNGSEQVYVQAATPGNACTPSAYMGQRYTTATIAAGQWYHVAGVFNAASQTLDIYLNGLINDGILSGTIPSSLYNSTGPLQVAQRIYDANYFQGSIDDVRLYSRALTAAEVLALYNAER